MKILLLGFGKIAYMPYMHFYLQTLPEAEFELVYWDRDGKPDSPVPEQIRKAYKFEAHLEEQMPLKAKLKYFYRYRRFVKKVLGQNRYDRIVVLHTTPGLTVLDLITRRYKDKYILDFRDVTYERVGFYRKLVARLANNAALVYVSSDAFRKFLPKLNTICTIHNFSGEDLEHRGAMTRAKDGVIRVVFWGLVRQLEVNKAFMTALGNDPRFELHYYGRMQQEGREMEAFSREKGYTNVFFHGSYLPAQRYDFAKNTELLHNVYNLGQTTRNAMGNKYYDGIIFGIPQICTAGSFMGEAVEKHGIGIAVEPEDPALADRLYDYFRQLDAEAFNKNCRQELERVTAEQNDAKEKLRNFMA